MAGTATHDWSMTDKELLAAIDAAGSESAYAAKKGCARSTLQHELAKRRRVDPVFVWSRPPAPAPPKPPPIAGHLGTPGKVTAPDGSVTVTSPPIPLSQVTDAEAYLRERWSLPVEKWLAKPLIANEWEANIGGGEIVKLGQVKGSFFPIATLLEILPRPAAWTGPRHTRPAKSLGRDKTWQGIYLADHQCPYIDEALHQAVLAAIRSIQPRKIGHVGDLADYTNISVHKDHAKVKAAVDECTDGAVHVLTDVRDAAPDAEIDILEGNHDIRPFSELLLRAERMAGIRSGSLRGDGGDELVTLDKMWRLAELGINMVSDPRGWMHGELEIVPGENGLVAVHGNLTGQHVAARLLKKVGRSVIFGHIHRPEHIFEWNTTIKREQQAMAIGCSCEVRGGGGKNYPTFVANDGWLQGPCLVTAHPDGQFVLERMRWDGTTLYAGRDRWSA